MHQPPIWLSSPHGHLVNLNCLANMSENLEKHWNNINNMSKQGGVRSWEPCNNFSLSTHSGQVSPRLPTTYVYIHLDTNNRVKLFQHVWYLRLASSEVAGFRSGNFGVTFLYGFIFCIVFVNVLISCRLKHFSNLIKRDATKFYQIIFG